MIGEGAFSTVIQAYSASDSEPQYALKKMIIQSLDTRKIAVAEIEAFRRFSHPNILKLIDTTEIKGTGGHKVIYLLLPRMKRGSLRNFLDGIRVGKYSAPTLSIVLESYLSICEAIDVLHSFKPSHIHQDIKPENILIGDDGQPYLIDFGSVTLAERRIESRKDALRIVDQAAEFCTASYRPPELYDPPRGATLDSRTDVWSLGCLLFAWWFGYSPFECDFTGPTKQSIRVVETSALRVLAEVPRPRYTTAGGGGGGAVVATTSSSRSSTDTGTCCIPADDGVVLSLVDWVLEKDCAVRPFASDIIEKLQATIPTLTPGEHHV
eukprot:CAMPEP_0174985448 /NCGR_PEP_ID=MMETSP0004_2-20121128/18346_1 /TAXON_ID=420556 /ORGANISM="Ochromonas sp., Strain CCMP1393" /LENGTH=322 /DNA_ID=CAMNT_0016238095 /DNA_START=150 /DNA_END=1118 /DNA_ORIENTATION=+